jgi:hypothetical protein
MCFFEETKYAGTILRGLDQHSEIAIGSVSAEEAGTGKAGDLSPVTTQIESSDATTTDDPATLQRHSFHIDYSIPRDPWIKRMRLITKTDEPLLSLYWRPFVALFTFPSVLYTGLQYSFCLCWISVISNIIAIVMPGPPWNFGSGAIGLMGMGPFIGCVIGSIYAGFLGDWTVVRMARRNQGRFEPEMRLHLQHAPAVILSVGVLVSGLTIAKVSCQCFVAIRSGVRQ